MRIISKTHDYYDAALVYGRDESLVFVREETPGPKELVDTFKEHLANTSKYSWDRSYEVGCRVPYSGYYPYIPDLVDKTVNSASVRAGIVGFCGVLYPIVIYRANLRTAYESKDVIETSYLLPGDDVEENAIKFYELIHKHTPKFASKYLESSKSRWRKNSSYSVQIHNTLASIESVADRFSSVFIDNKVPYFFVDFLEKEVKFLPSLKDLQFYKVKDPFTAMQELSMYVGGVIPRQEKELINISDKDRIAQHGFDKLSFRHPFK